jgi:hypothetical protein
MKRFLFQGADWGRADAKLEKKGLQKNSLIPMSINSKFFSFSSISSTAMRM